MLDNGWKINLLWKNCVNFLEVIMHISSIAVEQKLISSVTPPPPPRKPPRRNGEDGRGPSPWNRYSYFHLAAWAMTGIIGSAAGIHYGSEPLLTLSASVSLAGISAYSILAPSLSHEIWIEYRAKIDNKSMNMNKLKKQIANASFITSIVISMPVTIVFSLAWLLTHAITPRQISAQQQAIAIQSVPTKPDSRMLLLPNINFFPR